MVEPILFVAAMLLAAAVLFCRMNGRGGCNCERYKREFIVTSDLLSPYPWFRCMKCGRRWSPRGLFEPDMTWEEYVKIREADDKRDGC